MKVVLAGCTGLIGREVQRQLSERGHELVLLSRKPRTGQIAWDGETLGDWAEHLNGAGALINLAGASISLHWTIENRRQILQSRLASVDVLGRALRQATSPPSVWVQASAIGIYGDRGEELLSETSPVSTAEDFLVDTCTKWEAAAAEACPENVSLRQVRFGLVLGKGGGAFPPLLTWAKRGLGGALGSGDQYWSWIHLRDAAGMVCWLADGDARPNLVNAVSPNPLRQSAFMAALRKELGKPWAPPLPSPMLKLAAYFGAPAPELVLTSQRIEPRAALANGFSYAFPDLESALRDLLSP